MPIDMLIIYVFTRYMVNLIASNVPDYQVYLGSLFSAYLTDQKASNKTIQNYLSDCRNFFRWMTLRRPIPTTSSTSDAPSKAFRTYIQSVQSEDLEEYKGTLILSQIPSATINRRLSALRMLFRCLMKHNIIVNNVANTVQNVSLDRNETPETSLIFHFKQYLEKEGTAIQNIELYSADVNEFIHWLQHEHQTLRDSDSSTSPDTI